MSKAMSTAAGGNLGKLSEAEGTTAISARNSPGLSKDEEKLDSVDEQQNDEDVPHMSEFRIAILMLCLCLAMFLVALDFVGRDETIGLI